MDRNTEQPRMFEEQAKTLNECIRLLEKYRKCSGAPDTSNVNKF